MDTESFLERTPAYSPAFSSGSDPLADAVELGDQRCGSGWVDLHFFCSTAHDDAIDFVLGDGWTVSASGSYLQ